MFYAGIDWADQKHDGLMLDEAGQKLGSIRVAHTPEGLAKLDAWLWQMLGQQSQDQMACIIETTHGLLITFLLEHGWPVYPKSPGRLIVVARPRVPKRISLMPICWPKRDELTSPICTGSSPIAKRWPSASALTRDQDSLIQMQTRLLNQLTACLKAYYPVALSLFARVAAALCSGVLANLPNPGSRAGRFG